MEVSVKHQYDAIMTSFLIIVFPNFNALGCLDQILWTWVELPPPQCHDEIKKPSAYRVKQMSSSSFHMFIYARSEQCDLCPIYTITNTQRIRIYPGILKTLFTFLTTENLSRLPCSHECKYGAYSDLSSYAVNLPK